MENSFLKFQTQTKHENKYIDEDFFSSFLKIIYLVETVKIIKYVLYDSIIYMFWVFLKTSLLPVTRYWIKIKFLLFFSRNFIQQSTLSSHKIEVPSSLPTSGMKMISSRTLLPFSSPHQYILPDIHTKILCNNDNDFCRQLLTTTTFCCCVTVTPFGFDISIFEFSRHFILTSTMNLTGQSTSNSFKPQKLNLEPFRILQKSQTLNPQTGVSTQHYIPCQICVLYTL